MRGSFTEEEKERAQAFIRQNPDVKLPDLARKFDNISESSLAKWRQDIRNERTAGHPGSESDGSEGEKPKMSDKERIKVLEQELANYDLTVRIQATQFAHLRKYAKASTDLERKEIQILYFMALLRLYGCQNPERLDEESEGPENKGE